MTARTRPLERMGSKARAAGMTAKRREIAVVRQFEI
jgi:hypothetical protein